MNHDHFDEPIVLKNSPIDFVVSGPLSGSDRILIRSEAAPLDLIGLVAHEDGQAYSESRNGTVIIREFAKLLAFRPVEDRQLNLVDSHRLPDADEERDSRSSKFKFSWMGYASPSARERIESQFRRIAPILPHLVRKGDTAGVEWLIAPIVLDCADAEERRKRALSTYRSVFQMYLGATALGVAVVATLAALKGIQ